MQPLKASYLISILLLFIQAVCSQQPPCATRKLPVYFRDAQNLPLQNVSTADLDAKLLGKAVRIVSLAPDSRPHRVVLVVDSSGSMASRVNGPAPWDMELSLAWHFFESNRPRTRIAVLFFGEQVHDVIDFSRGNDAVGEKLQLLAQDRRHIKTQVKGRTALRDAIFEAIQLIDHPTSADAIYVLTDGDDNASHQGAKELDRRLALTSVRLFAVLLYQKPGAWSRTPEELIGPGELAAIAERSGGEILTAAQWSGKGVALSANAQSKVRTEETLSRLYQAIVQDSLLEVELPFPIAKSEHWDLKLSSAAQRQWKDAKITYPDTLVSCDSEVSGQGRN
jgi:Mg-chelatase subunit ChlD